MGVELVCFGRDFRIKTELAHELACDSDVMNFQPLELVQKSSRVYPCGAGNTGKSSYFN